MSDVNQSGATVRTLTREQLGSFLNKNHLLIKAFENLFQSVVTLEQLDPDVIFELIQQGSIESGIAVAKANSNSGQIAALQKTDYATSFLFMGG